jgi:hypothetical protein
VRQGGTTAGITLLPHVLEGRVVASYAKLDVKVSPWIVHLGSLSHGELDTQSLILGMDRKVDCLAGEQFLFVQLDVLEPVALPANNPFAIFGHDAQSMSMRVARELPAQMLDRVDGDLPPRPTLKRGGEQRHDG